MPHSGPEARGRLRREILGRDRTDQSDQSQGDQHKTHFHNVRPVAVRDTHIDDRRHDQRDKQLERGLQHLEKRRQHRFLFIVFQINKK